MNGPEPPRVAIVLSTFNGERFLDEQLRSYLAQTHTRWLLYWRDDGSSDKTAAIVRAFSEGPGNGRCTRVEGETRLGASRSFLTVLRAALAGPADYFAFSDQDDVWLAGKLAAGVAALSARPAPEPALAFCGRTLVDALGRRIGEVRRPRDPPGFPGALTQNVIPGCCMMLNRAAAALVAESTPPETTWHDWWCYLLVAASGGSVIGDARPGILYRQHGANLIGETRGVWTRAQRALVRGRKPFMTLLRSHVRALLTSPAVLPPGHRTVLERLERACGGGPMERLRALAIPGFSRQGPAETLLFRVWFLLG